MIIFSSTYQRKRESVHNRHFIRDPERDDEETPPRQEDKFFLEKAFDLDNSVVKLIKSASLVKKTERRRSAESSESDSSSSKDLVGVGESERKKK